MATRQTAEKLPTGKARSLANLTGGSRKGKPNKTTLAMKEAISSVYADLQAEAGSEHGHFKGWAEQNPTEFYKIAAKLIPQDVNANVNGVIGMPPINLASE